MTSREDKRARLGAGGGSEAFRWRGMPEKERVLAGEDGQRNRERVESWPERLSRGEPLYLTCYGARAIHFTGLRGCAGGRDRTKRGKQRQGHSVLPHCACRGGHLLPWANCDGSAI